MLKSSKVYYLQFVPEKTIAVKNIKMVFRKLSEIGTFELYNHQIETNNDSIAWDVIVITPESKETLDVLFTPISNNCTIHCLTNRYI